MKISIGSDHAGYEYKQAIIQFLSTTEFDVMDHGPASADSVDYPDFAHPVAKSIDQKEADLGILICGSGNGVAMTANKYQNVRAGLCWTKEIATLIKQHNNANVICIPARFTSGPQAVQIIDTFLNENFEGGRHERRVNKITSC